MFLTSISLVRENHLLHISINPSIGQSGLKGTSCPAHYTVLSDEVEFGLQPLQQLSDVLCHTQQRATRVVSLPAPLYCSWVHSLSIEWPLIIILLQMPIYFLNLLFIYS